MDTLSAQAEYQLSKLVLCVYTQSAKGPIAWDVSHRCVHPQSHAYWSIRLEDAV
jgi:hypothetical protein